MRSRKRKRLYCGRTGSVRGQVAEYRGVGAMGVESESGAIHVVLCVTFVHCQETV